MASSFDRSVLSALLLKYSKKSSLLVSSASGRCPLAHASMVAEEMITLNSGRFFIILPINSWTSHCLHPLAS